MIVTMVNSTYSGDTQSWASALVKEIKTGSYKAAAPGWINCSNTTQTLSRRLTIEEDVREILRARQSPSPQVTSLACPMVWAKESNAYDCVCSHH
jgi:hypothetical protein